MAKKYLEVTEDVTTLITGRTSEIAPDFFELDLVDLQVIFQSWLENAMEHGFHKLKFEEVDGWGDYGTHLRNIRSILN